MKMIFTMMKWLVFLAFIKNFSYSKANFFIANPANPFILEKPDLTAVEGSCVEIRCNSGRSVSYSAGAHWFWMKDAAWEEQKKGFNATRAYCSDVEECPVNTRLKDRLEHIVPPPAGGSYKSEQLCNILICDLNKTDSGEYKFRYINGDVKWETKPGTTLTVTENPCPITFNKQAAVREDERVTLTCSTLPLCPHHPKIYTLSQLYSSFIITQPETPKITYFSFTASWKHDGFEFSCQTPGNTDKYLIRKITLTVEYAPKYVSVAKSRGVVKEGDAVTLTCSAKGQPKVTFSWFKDDKNMTKLGAEIKFNSIKASANGSYHCVAVNKHGAVNSTKTNLNVLYPPELYVQIQKRNSVLYVVEGATVILTCTVKRSNPQPQEYTWFKNNTEVYKGETFLILRLKPEDSGHYRCVAKNSVGSGRSNFQHLDVKYKPRSIVSISGSTDRVKIYSSVQFECNTSANPSPSYYSWYRYKQSDPSNWTPMTSNRVILTFGRIERSDEACYLCNTTNNIGRGEMSKPRCIQVLFPPTNLTLSRPTKVREGQDVTFTCSAESYPLSHFELKRSSSPSPLFSKPPDKENTFTYTFKATSADSDSYFCSASNSEGSNSSTGRSLEVEYSPKDVKTEPQSGLEVNENAPFSLNCRGHSNPSITSFTWMKKIDHKEVNVVTSELYSVKAANLSHEGLYRCEAKNGIGIGKSTYVKVKIKYAPKQITIKWGKEQQLPDGWRSVTLSCSTQCYPKAEYVWFNKTTDREVSKGSEINVKSNQLGELYCVAQNDVGKKLSDPIRPFDDRIKIMSKILLICFAALIILLIFFLYRYKNNNSNQRTANMCPCCGFLVWWDESRRRTRMNETMLAEPSRSRNDLLMEQPDRLMAQRPPQQPPDATSSSNINSVYATVSQPQGKQAPSAQTAAGQQRENMEDDFLNYASLHYAKKKKMEEDPVYSRVCKPKPSEEIEQQNVEVYENLSSVKPPKPSFSYDSDTSEEEVEVNYTQVNIKSKRGHQRDSSSSEDDIQYSQVQL